MEAGAPRFWTPRIRSETRADGSILVWQADPLPPHEGRTTDALVRWAREAPGRCFLAQREGGGDWRRVSYAEALDAVSRLGQALLDLGLSAERPLLILSGNGIAHALLALAAQHVGIPSAAISPAYALVATDFGKLAEIAAQLTPGLVFAEDGAPFARAIAAAFAPDLPVLVLRNPPAGRRALLLADLLRTEPGPGVAAAHAAVGRETVAKFLFTSGTTGTPKAVIQSHGMITANQAMVRDCFAFLADRPPVVVDWAPWNHTASGNKVFHMVLTNGGTYHIDEGRPTPAGMAETIRNLREIPPSWYFNVPAGYEMLIAAMEADAALRRNFFRDLAMMMYAGAGMPQHLWDRLRAMARATLGRPVLLTTGLGATETGPFALMCMEEQEHPGNVGIPARGVLLKLVPQDGRLEARLKGPSITPGYWRNPALTAAAFDAEGFYRLGDALRFAVPGDPARGFLFDGRIAENFKLGTGTWVSVGALRARLVNDLGGLARDCVIAGEDRDYLAAILFPDRAALRALLPPGEAVADADLAAHPAVRAALAERLSAHAEAATGSATRVMRAILADAEPSFETGEVTDKGSINQRAVLRQRPHLVAALYGEGDPRVVTAGRARPAA